MDYKSMNRGSAYVLSMRPAGGVMHLPHGCRKQNINILLLLLLFLLFLAQELTGGLQKYISHSLFAAGGDPASS